MNIADSDDFSILFKIPILTHRTEKLRLKYFFISMINDILLNKTLNITKVNSYGLKIKIIINNTVLANEVKTLIKFFLDTSSTIAMNIIIFSTDKTIAKRTINNKFMLSQAEHNNNNTK